MRAFLAGVCCVLASAVPARADWEFTRWGMSVAELRKAAPVPVSLARMDERVFKRILRESSILAYIPRFNWLGHRFELRFGFDRTAKLNRIFLVAPDDRFRELADVLTRIHGEPLSEAEAPLPCRLWRDEVQDDYVRLRWTGVTIVEQIPGPTEPTSVACTGAERAKPTDRSAGS